MACCIFEARDPYGDREVRGAVLYCSTSEWAFGPVFASVEAANDFMTWLAANPDHALCDREVLRFSIRAGRDPRDYPEAGLVAMYGRWLAQRRKNGEMEDSNDAVHDPKL